MAEGKRFGGGRQRGLSTWRYGLFLVVAVVIGMEVLLRAVDPIGIVYLYDARRYFKTLLVDDERFSYIHAPNSEGSLNGEALRFNSIGLRGPEMAREKPAGSPRLMVLGDSVVLGWGVSEEAMFASQLQQMFASRGMPADVMVAGVGSWNTRTEFEWLRHIGVDYVPDVLLLLIVPNDTDPKREGGYTEVPREQLFPPAAKQDRSLLANWAEDFWRSAARISYVAAYLKYFWQETLGHGSRPPVDQDSPQWRDARLALDGIIDLTRERGIDLIVVLDGSRALLASNPILRLYDQHLRSRGIQGLPLADELFTQALRISMVDSHLNEEGNRILAEELFAYLVPMLVPASAAAGPPSP